MKSMVLMIPMTIGLALAAGQAKAEAVSSWASAADNCQGALPSFEGAFRKRPLGINNEGTSLAFLSCSLRAPLSSEQLTDVLVLFTNRGSDSATINCTLVDGVATPFPSYPPVYLPKSAVVVAGGFTVMQWTMADNGDLPYVIPNLSCSLPPGTEINVLQTNVSAPL